MMVEAGKNSGIGSLLGSFLGGGGTVTNLKGLVLIHLNIFVYALCFWIQQPVLPYLSKDLGGNAVAFGALGSAVSFMALIGGALMGRWTDTQGAKRTLIISHLGSLAMYSSMAMATSFPILFISRIPALVQHAMMCAQAAISELAPLQYRSVAMGRLSLSYAVGMVLGSPLGGKAAEVVGYHAVAALAAFLTLIMIGINILYLPEFKKKAMVDDKKENKAKEENASTIEQMKEFFKVVMTPRVRNLLLFIFPISVGIGAFRAMMSLAGKAQFGLESSDLGMYISYAAFVGLVTNVVFISLANKHLGDFYTVLLASFGQMACYGSFPFISTYSEFLLLTIPSTIASTLLYTLSSSMMSLAVEESHTATAIAVSHGSRSLVGIISPIIGGFVYDNYGFGGLGTFAAACCASSGFIAMSFASQTLHELQEKKRKASASKEKTT